MRALTTMWSNPSRPRCFGKRLTRFSKRPDPDMQNNDLNEILSKINEMRAAFVLGQRAIPFLEEIFVFLREISPLLNDINVSIRDSTSKMPRATSQLLSVSSATETDQTQVVDPHD